MLGTRTRKALDSFLKKPSGVCILENRGDNTSAQVIISEITVKLLDDHSTVYEVDIADNSKSIGIDQIREMKSYLEKTSSDTSSSLARLVVIHRAETLTEEAQNAVLKLLEELHVKTLIILDCTHAAKLLETVRSRSVVIENVPISLQAALDSKDLSSFDQKEIKQAYFLSEGYPGTLSDILNGNSDLTDRSDTAKKFIGASVFQRQRMLKNDLKDIDIDNFLHILRILSISALRNVKTADAKHKWKKNIQVIELAKKHSEARVNSKLNLLNLSVELQ